MDRVPVSSTNIATVGYDETIATLEIEFHSGGVYQYYNVPANVHLELMTASSTGGYFARNIKNVYACTKV
jgi:hypothetical protein